jgi:hypothetical protein
MVKRETVKPTFAAPRQGGRPADRVGDCRSPGCDGLIVTAHRTGLPIDPKLGSCDLCGLLYRRKLLGWTVIEGPVVVTVHARDEPVRCDRVSFEPGVVLLTHSDDDRPERVHLSEIERIARPDS